MGVCCKCDSKPDILTEIKKGSIAEGSAAAQYSKLIFTDATNAEQILLKQKENPLKEYSLLLFQELNKFRTEPQKYLSEGIKYNFGDIVNELMKIKNQRLKDLKLEWSTKKEIIINNIMNDENIKDIRTKLGVIKQKFESLFDLIILFVQSDFANIKESLWDVLDNFKKLDENKFFDIILNKIDYCVIYSIKSDNLIFKKLCNEEGDSIDIDIVLEKDEKEENKYDNKETDNLNNNDKIISFYFLFNYLEDDDKSYNNITNNNVVSW